MPLEQLYPRRATPWVPMSTKQCTFAPDHFLSTIDRCLRNPNRFTSSVYRAETMFDTGGAPVVKGTGDRVRGAALRLPSYLGHTSILPSFDTFSHYRTAIYKVVPASPERDKDLLQTAVYYQRPAGKPATLVVCLPDVASAEMMPYYHPKVRGLAYVYEWEPALGRGILSVYYSHFPGVESQLRDKRTAAALVTLVHKFGQGEAMGYVKRVEHDVIISQKRFQDRNTVLKTRLAEELFADWGRRGGDRKKAPKYIFEDIGIAAFLMELWHDMYGGDGSSPSPNFPGFVDLACGNGLLVHILNKYNYRGWGLDACKRTAAWEGYNAVRDGQDTLREMVMVPWNLLQQTGAAPADSAAPTQLGGKAVHDGRFPRGTFIIGNHSDELTPWVPILAAQCGGAFLTIPCCSHDLGGRPKRFHAPGGNNKNKSKSKWSGLLDWVNRITADCGFEPERENMRIPSTRNVGVLGRNRTRAYADVDLAEVIRRYGGADGYLSQAYGVSQNSGDREHSQPFGG